MKENVPADSLSTQRQMLALQLSYRCNAICRSCAFDCSPGSLDVMSMRNACKVLDRANDLPVAPIIGFTGGEPFFHLNFLRDLCRLIKNKLDFKIIISTNAFWAKTIDQTKDLLQEFLNLGLVSLLISMDDFHQEFVPLGNIRNTLTIAQDLNITCALQCIETRTSRKADDFIQELDIELKEDLVKIVSNPCTPVGRAVREIPEDEFVHSWQNQAGTCSMLSIWLTDPRGKVVSCCGPVVEEFPFVGNAFEESIADIIHSANADPLLNALAAWGGPFLLFKVLAENGFPHFATGRYVSACHACYCLFRNQAAMDVLREKLSERQVELAAARLIARENLKDWRLSGKEDTLSIPAAW